MHTYTTVNTIFHLFNLSILPATVLFAHHPTAPCNATNLTVKNPNHDSLIWPLPAVSQIPPIIRATKASNACSLPIQDLDDHIPTWTKAFQFVLFTRTRWVSLGPSSRCGRPFLRHGLNVIGMTVTKLAGNPAAFSAFSPSSFLLTLSFNVNLLWAKLCTTEI